MKKLFSLFLVLAVTAVEGKEVLAQGDFADCVIQAKYLQDMRVVQTEMKAEIKALSAKKLNKADAAELKKYKSNWESEEQQLVKDIKSFQDSSCLGIRLFSASEAAEICAKLNRLHTPYCRKYTQ